MIGLDNGFAEAQFETTGRNLYLLSTNQIQTLRSLRLCEKKMKPQPGKYKHYKGKLYEVIGTAHHSETLEDLVVYKALYQPEGENLWVRPLKMFNEEVEVEGIKKPRFEFINQTL